MKFAVVEYTSKSGHIWRHSRQKPNYLADPLKEIDPTSFGCYVSALEGEHIPLKSFIVRKESGANKLTIFIRKVIKRITGQWPQNYPLEYFSQFDALLVVHQISDAHEMAAFAARMRQQYPAVKLIGVPTQPFGLLKKHLVEHPQALVDLKDFMAHCHVFITVVEDTQAAWQALSPTPVVYLPQPYPVDYAITFHKPFAAKKKVLFVAGMTTRPDIARGQAVAKRLQEFFPEYSIHVTDDPEVDTSRLAGTRFEKVPFRPWQQQLQYLAEVALVINTDYTQTRGRVQMDCGAVGTVSIGADSDGQRDIFPDLPADINTSIDELVAQAKKLLTDPVFYEQTISRAQHKLTTYNYQNSAQRIRDLVSGVDKTEKIA